MQFILQNFKKKFQIFFKIFSLICYFRQHYSFIWNLEKEKKNFPHWDSNPLPLALPHFPNNSTPYTTRPPCLLVILLIFKQYGSPDVTSIMGRFTNCTSLTMWPVTRFWSYLSKRNIKWSFWSGSKSCHVKSKVKKSLLLSKPSYPTFVKIQTGMFQN